MNQIATSFYMVLKQHQHQVCHACTLIFVLLMMIQARAILISTIWTSFISRPLLSLPLGTASDESWAGPGNVANHGQDGNFRFCTDLYHHILWHNYVVISSILSCHKTVMYLPEAAVLLLAVAASQFDDFALQYSNP